MSTLLNLKQMVIAVLSVHVLIVTHGTLSGTYLPQNRIPPVEHMVGDSTNARLLSELRFEHDVMLV